MPVTVNHVLTATTPDDPDYEIRPSHWNSAHALTLSLVGSEVSPVFSNANGISFGLSGTAITGSYTVPDTSQFLTTAQPVGAYLTTARASNDAVGLNTALTAGPLAWTVNSGGISLNAGSAAGTTTGFTGGASISGSMTHNTAGLAVSLAHPAWLTTAAASGHSHGNPTLNLTNLSGTTASNSAGFTLSLSAAAPGAGGGAAISAGANSQNTGTVNFANSNGVTFGLSNNGTMTASHNGLTTARASNDAVGLNTALTAGPLAWTVNSGGISLNAGSAAGTSTGFTGGASISGSMTHNTAGLAVSLAHPAWLTTAAQSNHSHGNPTLALTNLSGTTASASNGLTISLSAAAPGGGGGAGTNTALNLTNLTGTLAVNTNGVSLSMSAAAPGAAAAVNRSFFEIMDGERITTCALLNNATYSKRHIFVPFWMDGEGLSCKTVEFAISRTGGTSLAMTAGVGFYSFSNSTRIDLVSSTTNAFSLTTSAQFSGIRRYPITGLSNFALSEGRWVMAAYFSAVSSASMGLNLMGGDAVNVVGFVLPGTNSTAATNSQSHWLPFWGVYSATSAAFPASVALSHVSGGASPNSPDIYAVIREI